MILTEDIVKIPPSSYSKNALEEDPRKWPFFEGCIGALDGVHIPIFTSAHQQSTWRNWKGWISQNVLAVCDFDLNFVYLFAGMEGSAHDSCVLSEAQEKDDFTTPADCYFLADAGYSTQSDMVLVPYSGV